MAFRMLQLVKLQAKMSLSDTPLLFRFSICEWASTNLETLYLILDHLDSRDLAGLFPITATLLK
jgi:hypothetical protein